MRARVMLTCLVLLSTTLAGCIENDHGDEDGHALHFNGMSYDEPTTAPDFTLIDQNGESVTLSAFEDKVVVIAFTYTHCPDVCLAIEANLAAVEDRFEGEDDLVILSITIDPARDTPAHLAEWTAARGYDWPHLTSAEHSDLQSVWSDYNLLVDNDQIYSDHSDHGENDSQMSHHEMMHNVAILYPDNTTTMVNSTLTGWSLTNVALDQAGIELNGSSSELGHFVNGIGGHDSPSDWSWWWSLQVWNASNTSWEEASVGIDAIEMSEATHIAWAASSADASAIPAPEDGGHSVDVLFPDETHARIVVEDNYTGWDLMVAATADHDIAMNASDSKLGHFVNGFEGVDSPSDGSWWWSMLFWNETSEAWEKSAVGLDDLQIMVDANHIAFAASNANLSMLPAPHAAAEDQEHDHEDHTADEDEVYLVGHNTVTFIVDLDGNKRVVHSGADWSIDDFAEDLEALLSEHDEADDGHGH